MLAPTLEKAAQNNQLKGIPCMNVKDIQRYLTPSPATANGRMKKPKAGIESIKNEQISIEEDMYPSNGSSSSEGMSNRISNVFLLCCPDGEGKGTMYTYATGALPVMSLDRKQYYCVAYNYDNKYIHAKDVDGPKDETIVKTVKDFFTTMKELGQ